MDLDKLLNKNQKEAATYLDSHLRIIAGAGSGKTRVITYRIAYLIDEIGVDPRKILAITFTNKAANEMKERVVDLLGVHALGSLICTIHSLCVRILRQHINVINYPSNFTIMDEEDQKALIKKIYNQLQIDAKTISIKSMIATISNYKMANITPEKALEFAGSFQGEIKKAKVYKEYLEYQENHFLLDFDDLLLKTVYIFENYPDVLEKWQYRFQYIHVDEFQDVGNIEYRLVKLMSDKAITCVVGDPDQTIYSFRGANVNYILDFDKDFKPCKTIILNQNYRSTGNILNISNCLIRKNQNRLEKELFTEATGGGEVIHYTAKNEQDEAEYICSEIEKIINDVDGVNYRNFAILYRANYLSRTIEQCLISHGIDYRIFGGLKFFSRKEIKDALSYLQLVCNGEDLAFERIINVPSRGIGKKTMENIQAVAKNNHVSLYEALTLFSDQIKLSSKAKKEIKILVAAIEKAKQSNLPLHIMFENLMNDIGYIEMLNKNLEENRIDNIHELQRSIYEFENQNPDLAKIENYLQEIALYTDSDDNDDSQYVSLMSIHMAKGLEFDYVFVLGLSEGIFPSFRALSESDEGIEEERRLAYVAFTRAKKQLYLTDSEGFSFVTDSPKISSRFVEEIGKEGIKHLGTRPRFKTSNYINTNLSKEELIGNNQVSDWTSGDFVIHDTFGKGVVVKVNGKTLDIAFELPAGLKTLMAGHKALKKLTN
ncbi:MAG: UvrD-helicase domain-containing protein [[Clostridium] spiroforme]|uniref:DNA 3'-5' helicase n=1 Tax=Thomasclavelia spiroformis TaxID=29348 RepID=A0A943I3Z6_9FIRM|nr:ATP-dependent helicase [Thomasclavelia spiroformis]MBS5588142.1 UvrD-helicase domain-containing protein [Thomasclavelia spiroformis]